MDQGGPSQAKPLKCPIVAEDSERTALFCCGVLAGEASSSPCVMHAFQSLGCYWRKQRRRSVQEMACVVFGEDLYEANCTSAGTDSLRSESHFNFFVGFLDQTGNTKWLMHNCPGSEM